MHSAAKTISLAAELNGAKTTAVQ